MSPVFGQDESYMSVIAMFSIMVHFATAMTCLLLVLHSLNSPQIGSGNIKKGNSVFGTRDCLLLRLAFWAKRCLDLKVVSYFTIYTLSLNQYPTVFHHSKFPFNPFLASVELYFDWKENVLCNTIAKWWT